MAGKTWEEKQRMNASVGKQHRENMGKAAERLASLPWAPPVQPKTAQPKSVPQLRNLHHQRLYPPRALLRLLVV